MHSSSVLLYQDGEGANASPMFAYLFVALLLVSYIEMKAMQQQPTETQGSTLSVFKL